MLEQIRAISLQSQQAQVPAQFLFATVTNLAPLTVQVDSRFYLTAPALMTLAPHTHGLNAHATEETILSVGSHSHAIAQQETQDNQGYDLGDSVVLLRNAGGQCYLLLGRVAL